MKCTTWLWPDHVIVLEESRKLREEHNDLVDSHYELTKSLRRLLDATLSRESTMGDPCNLIAAQEELTIARRLANATLNRATAE